MKIVLLRVGIDKICGGIHSPLFKDGTFEFVPIPEYFYRTHPFDATKVKTFTTEEGVLGKPLIEYFKTEGKDKEQHRDCPVHIDPDFETYTYGDANATKQTLVNLEKGDYIVFYASLEGFDFQMAPAMYVIGYFEVDYSLLATEESQFELLTEDFAQNFHIKNKEIFSRDISNSKNKGLKLVKGTENSRKLKYAYLISRTIEIPEKSDIHVISDDMLKIFGSFGGKIAIQKEPLRWIKDKSLVARTIEWLKGLE
jgi:Nucleotide modification associated domain 3